MNISIVNHKFKRGGGMERYLMDLIQGLHDRNITPTVYSCSFDKNIDEYQLINPVNLNISYIPKKIRNLFISFVLKRKYRNEGTLLSLSYNYSDIIICGGQHKGYLKALNKTASLFDKIKIWNEQKSLNQTKLIIAHSNLMKEELCKLYNISPSKIKVIYPPVNTKVFNPINDEERKKLRAELGFKAEDILYLFPSTGHKRKGYDILKQFFNHTDLPIKLLVAGTPVTESKNIISLGFRNDISKLYRVADFTIMASSYEPFGLIGIESILSGTPIIFAENIGCLEVLDNNFGFSFEPNNIKSLEDTIEKSIVLINRNEARINDPKNCIKYNPTLAQHINEIEKHIYEINSK